MRKNHNNSSLTLLDSLEKRLELIFKKDVIILAIICFATILIRLYFFPYNIPITLDGLLYFWYAIDMSIIGNFPTYSTYPMNFPNNGWPALLSLFFSFLNSNNPLDYMMMQRFVSLSISVLTIIPIYLLCIRFFKKSFALVGASLFAFEPRLIQNSLQGITEPLYILLGTTALFLFFSDNKKSIYAAFGVVALFSFVRFEGLLLIIPFTIMYFVRFRKSYRDLFKYSFAILVFLLILFPMVYVRIESTGQDGLVSHILAGPRFVSNQVASGDLDDTDSLSDVNENRILHFVFRGSLNLIKYLGWMSIPLFIFFMPLGIILLFRNMDYKKLMLILVSFFLLLPAFYGYARDLQDVRYLYILIPIICIISLYTINKFENKFKHNHLTIFVLLVGIFFVSLIFLDVKKQDLEHEKEAAIISLEIEKRTKVINDFYPEDAYTRSAEILNLETFPILSSTFEHKLDFVSTNRFISISEYIEFAKEKGLTHLVIDDQAIRTPFLKEIFDNETKYSFLVKEYDSKQYGFNYHVKIFRIDYNSFNLAYTSS